MWVDNSKILTMALGDSMNQRACAHEYALSHRGIAETFMSTLLLILVKQHRIDLDWTIGRWFPGLLATVTVALSLTVCLTA